MNAKNKNLEGMLRDLLESRMLAVLATQRNGRPYASLVAFAATQDFKEILFATTRPTRKFANMISEPHVALLIDNRTNQVSDIHEAVAVTALGTAEEVGENERAEALPIYLAKHPHLNEFVASPTCALLRVRVDAYYMVSRFQEVMELHIQP